MHIHPTRGYRGCFNTRRKPTNRRIKPHKAHRKDYEASRLAAEVGRFKYRAKRRTGRAAGIAAGVATTLFKIEQWTPIGASLEMARKRHIHPRRLRNQ